MFGVIKHINRQLTIVKKVKPPVNIKKHKYDIENESWIVPNKQKTTYVYRLIKIKKNEKDKLPKNNKEN